MSAKPRQLIRLLIAARLLVVAMLMAPFGLLPAHAQDDGSSGGQFCVRAFEDLNANGARDAGEQLIMEDVVANLQDAQGVVIQTATMAESQSRGQGLICFRDLPPGQYSLFVTSAAWEPTGDANLTAAVRQGQLPALLEYGAQPGSTSGPASGGEGAANTGDTQVNWQRVLVAALGGLGAMGAVGLLGVALFVFVFRRRTASQPAAEPADPHAPFRPPPRNDQTASASDRPRDDMYGDYQEFR